jgi:threonine/homoserine/homoserine lactone efflux protein
MNRKGRRHARPTAAGYVVLAIIGILAVAVVVGVIIGGSAGATVDAVAGFMIVAFILWMVGGPITRRPREVPRDPHPRQPPDPDGLQ